MVLCAGQPNMTLEKLAQVMFGEARQPSAVRYGSRLHQLPAIAAVLMSAAALGDCGPRRRRRAGRPSSGGVEGGEGCSTRTPAARWLTAADSTPAQADALTDAFRLVVEQGEHVTSDQFKAGLAEMRAQQRTEIAGIRTEIAGIRTEIAEVRTEIANLDTRLSTHISTAETRLTWRMLGIAGLVIAALRLLG